VQAIDDVEAMRDFLQAGIERFRSALGLAVEV
jgi:hypothetical protein